MCGNKGPTITVLKLKNEISIIGGYNPLNWDKGKMRIMKKLPIVLFLL